MLSSPLDLEELREVSLYQFQNDHDLFKEILTLSEIFNHKRNDLNSAYLNEKQISAYLAFFFGTNFPKVKKCLQKIPRELSDEINKQPLVEFGCGPGTFIYGLLDCYPDFKEIIFGVDQSKIMLDQAKLIHSKKYSEFNISFQSSIAGIPKKSTLVFSNSLNEINEFEFKDIVNKIEPSVIIFLEPGTQVSFSKVLETREFLFGNGYNVIFPCASNEPCAIENEPMNWCHQFLKLTHSESIERLCQKVKKDRRNAPVVFHVYSKIFKLAHDQVVFRCLPETKFSYEIEVCSQNKIIKHRILKKKIKELGYKKKDVKDQLVAGKTYNCKIIRQIKENYFESLPEGLLKR